MFKMSFAVYRRADLTQEAFLAYWSGPHADLVRQHASALRIRRYVQLHAVPSEMTLKLTQARQCMPPHDGVSQIWWDSEADRLAAAASEEGRRASEILREDELQLCDVRRGSVAFGYEHVIIDDGWVSTDR